MTDTIAAVATANAPGGIGIVRVSGPQAFGIAQKIFQPKRSLHWERITGYKMAYGAVGVPPIDDAICLFFRGPGSYTGEDVIEFQCHGGPLLLQQVLQAAFEAGARMAQPGEFTRRAWLNGKLKLNQAEAIMPLVSAQSEQALRAAHQGLGAALAERIGGIRENLTALAAHIAAWTDYPEEDILPLGGGEVQAVLRESEEALAQLIGRSQGVRAALEGVSAALVGRPNVGKSSLLNRLAGYERAIVAPLPGTTRDTVTETVQLGSLTLRLTDTAGLRETSHPVEKAGVERSEKAMQGADLIFVVLDSREGITADDEKLLGRCDADRTIVVFNKIDLIDALQTPRKSFLQAKEPWKYVVFISAVTGEGLEELTRAAEKICQTESFAPGTAMLATQRQAQCAAQAQKSVLEALGALQAGFPFDAISVCLEDAVQALFSLTGERAGEAVADEVFKNFCVGK